MRAPLISLLISAAGLAAGGCASSPPQEEPPVTFTDRACSGAASDPLHLTTNKTVADRGDPEIQSILTQRGDPRLVWVNRQMYQTLHALDVELRREQRIAACERSQSGLQTLEAQAGGGANGSVGSGASGTGASGSAVTSGGTAGGGTAGGGAMASGGAASGGTVAGGAVASGGGASGGSQGGPVVLATADVPGTQAAATNSAGANGATATAMTAASSRSALIKKSSLSSAGNGATMPKVVAGSDNDIVARRLRKAAEQETDPALRQKLWKEYADYRQGIAAK
jgi:hypothetical protein